MNLKLRRLIATAIDYAIIMIVVFAPMYFLQNINNWVIKLIFSIICFIIVVFLFIRKDVLIGYESLGKKIMFLRIHKNGKRLFDKQLLKDRNKCTSSSFPVYPLHILIDNKSVGDEKYNTEIVSTTSNSFLNKLILIIAVIIIIILSF